jgi:hypothetical protein
MPQTLRAPDGFSFEKYAANVGLVIVSGKRFWQRAPVHLLSTPKFDYRPTQYRPRPLPVAAVMKVAVALVLGFGVFTSYQLQSDQAGDLEFAQRNVEILTLRTDLRTQSIEETRSARLVLEEAKAKTERLIAANEVLQDREAGYGDTVSIISGIAPSDVTVEMIDDDGEIVAVEATSDDYPEMLAYIRLLEDVPQFDHVQVLSITRAGASDDSEDEPSGESGAPVIIETFVEASLVINRIEIDDSQLLVGEELAVVTESK